jgi:hypothetical protein
MLNRDTSSCNIFLQRAHRPSEKVKIADGSLHSEIVRSKVAVCIFIVYRLSSGHIGNRSVGHEPKSLRKRKKMVQLF